MSYMSNLLLVTTDKDVFFGFCIAFAVVLLLASIAMITIVLMQRGTDSNGMGAIMGGSDTFFGTHKARSIDGKFKLATVIVAATMLVSSILFFVFLLLLNKG